MQCTGSMIWSSFPFSLNPGSLSIMKIYLSLLCRHYRNDVVIQNHIHGCNSCTVRYITDALCCKVAGAGQCRKTLTPHTSYYCLTTQNREDKRSFTLELTTYMDSAFIGLPTIFQSENYAIQVLNVITSRTSCHSPINVSICL